MTERLRIGAVIPARDEEDNIGAVVRALRALRTRAGDALIDDIVVCGHSYGGMVITGVADTAAD